MEKRNILIWGAGLRGEKVYGLLEKHRRYNVIAFGDNDANLWGKEKLGKTIVGPSQVCDLKNIDCIMIASAYTQEIKEQLQGEIAGIPIYESIDDLMYTRMSIDISGFCNAKCKWCVTGRKNRDSKQINIDYLSLAEFVRLYEHMYGKGLMEKSTELMLYSWGEPLLNKDYIGIIEYLAQQNQKFSVSTNASKVCLTNKPDTYKNCCAFVFSMSGFSQLSYDRIHGFSFERIKENIKQIVQNLREAGFQGDGSISYHVYKFNMEEIENAREFANSLGLKFNPYYPYFNGNSMIEAYLDGSMPEEMQREAEQELYLSHVKGLLNQRPENYQCFLANIISVDCNGNLVLCCASDEGLTDYAWGSIYDIHSYEELRTKRQVMLKSHSCQKCRYLAIDYWMGNNPAYVDFIKENKPNEE